MNKLLEASLENLKEELWPLGPASEQSNGRGRAEYRSPRDYGYYSGGGDRPKNSVIGRLRLDWADERPGINDLDSLDDMLRDIGQDLDDLIENGDTDLVSDALYKSFDGSKKRGLSPVKVDIFSAILFSEFSIRRNQQEYTLFLLMYVEWA